MAYSPESSHWSLSRISAFLGVDSKVVDYVVNGAPRLLFGLEHPGKEHTIIFFPDPLRYLLRDAKRSGQFFVHHNSLDPVLFRILSSPLPPTSSNPRPQDVLRDVLTLILVTRQTARCSNVPKAAAALNVSAGVVEHVVKAGPSRLLFGTSRFTFHPTFVTTSLADFLRDPDRSKEFCITDPMIDALFIRILSLPPPPHLATPPSKGDILRVIAVILASPESLTASKIATLLRIDGIVVEAVVDIMPTSVLFKRNGKNVDKLGFSGPFLKPFLHDPHRSGEFFISPTITLDEIPELWPQYPSNSPQVRASDSRHLDSNADERESPLGESAEKSEVVALPSSTVPKRKFSQ